jgi:biofilm protein TabA
VVFANIKDAEKYYQLNSKFQKAFDFLKSNDLAKMEAGKYEIDGENIVLIIAEDDARPDFKHQMEVHRKYIDIQLAIEGEFTIAWKHLSDCKSPINEFSEENDAQLFDDPQYFDIKLSSGNFAILFPEDAHGPYPPKEYLKKAVVKVAVA